MIATETIVPSRKLKIKFSTKNIGVDIGAKCEFGQKMSHIEQSGHCNSKESSSVPCSHKRGPPGSIEGQRDKRQKMDRKLSQQCAAILKSLTSHRYSWVFSKPVDPVALNIPDYFTIISEPMDLGTIKSKLEKNLYSGTEEFAADVRLTFSNAMTYNPPSNHVHLMAKELNKIFLKRWNDMEKKWKGEGEGGCMISAIKEPVRKSNAMAPQPQNFVTRKPLLAEEKSVPKSSSLVACGSKVSVVFCNQKPYWTVQECRTFIGINVKNVDFFLKLVSLSYLPCGGCISSVVLFTCSNTCFILAILYS